MLSRRMLSKTSAGAAAAPSDSGLRMPLPPAVEKRCKEMGERRRLVEQARQMTVRRIQQDIQRIAQRELDYAERMLAEYAPVKVSFNESAWSRLQEFLPIRLEFTEKPVATEAEGQAADAAPAASAEVPPEAPIA